MTYPKLNPEQTIQRISQMRRLGLSLREAYEKQYLLHAWMARFETLRALPADRFPMELTHKDLEALRAGFRENWAQGNYAIIVEVAKKLPADILQREHLLTAYAAAAREQLERNS
ncbi:MAG: hypothetical protein ONB45_20080 [candidate division KSB1 bacterium]|nr:hypothetical protein [candidate division KSB1 bacterium]